MVNFNESYWGGGDEPPDDEERDEEEAKDVMKIGAKYHEGALKKAVKYRQPQIVEELHSKSSFKDKSIFTSLCQQVDNNGNTMLHLAAYTSLNKETTWTISGPAMQMMCDVKWYKHDPMGCFQSNPCTWLLRVGGGLIGLI
ncbi:hypothetical protein L195_g026418 [Trifolium pratense]|uniref:Ankyrin repeat-containing protein n=1 Tax=Trifolium pratense TaxID=57577 RepID=A0A2K3NJ75_TRIPR|nr:hypothetical protein L195_g026418 [Trifolium pratense]